MLPLAKSFYARNGRVILIARSPEEDIDAGFQPAHQNEAMERGSGDPGNSLGIGNAGKLICDAQKLRVENAPACLGKTRFDLALIGNIAAGLRKCGTREPYLLPGRNWTIGKYAQKFSVPGLEPGLNHVTRLRDDQAPYCSRPGDEDRRVSDAQEVENLNLPWLISIVADPRDWERRVGFRVPETGETFQQKMPEMVLQVTGEYCLGVKSFDGLDRVRGLMDASVAPGEKRLLYDFTVQKDAGPALPQRHDDHLIEMLNGAAVAHAGNDATTRASAAQQD